MRYYAIGAALALVLGVQQGQAAVVQIGSASDLSAADSVFSIPGSGTGEVGSPVTYTGSDNSFTFSAANGGLSVETVGSTYIGSAFPDGQRIIYADGFNLSSGPLTLTFSSAVREFGFGAEEFENGDYVMTFTVNYVTVAGRSGFSTFTSNGNDPSSLSFIGARATNGERISSVVLSDNRGNDVSIGPVTYANAAVTAAVPEPATWALMLAGFGLVGAGMRQRRRTTATYA